MKVAILSEYPSQPAKTMADNIAKHSNHEVENYHRFANIFKIDADVIYYLNILDLLLHPQAFNQVIKADKKICTTIKSHRLVHNSDILNKLKGFGKYINVLGSVNQEILDMVPQEIYNGIRHKVCELPDIDMFYEIRPVSVYREKLRVGYVGTFRDVKRYKPVLESVFSELRDYIEPVVFGNAGKHIPHCEMVQAYNNMDLLVCTSQYEGSPLPPLEAALCGRMTITTACGEMPLIFDIDSACIIPNFDDVRKVRASLSRAIAAHCYMRNEVVDMGQKAKEVVKEKRNWNSKIIEYDEMFEKCLCSSR